MLGVDQLKILAKKVLGPLPPQVRQPPSYWQMKRFLAKAQWWSAAAIAQWQLAKLQEVIAHAYATVPGYRDLYRQAGFVPEDLRDLGCLKALPFVTKELLRDNLADFTSTAVPARQLRYLTTGGSTGIPFGFNLVSRNTHIERAFIHAGWERTGWRLGEPSAVLRGAYVGSREHFWKWDPFTRELLLSSYFLTESTFRDYAAAIRSRGLRNLQAYPSSLAMFSDLALQFGEKLDLKVLFLGSENVYSGQKEKIRRAFPAARLYAWYGHAEQAVLAAMCEHTDAYHLWPFYGYTEILDLADRDTTIGATGELVGTSFWCTATPFIRYRTMDLAVRGTDQCDRCDRHFPLLERIEGRLQEIIVTGTGRYISMTAINMHDDIFDPLRQFQFFQEEPGRVVFKYVPKGRILESEVLRISQRLRPKLGEDTDLLMVQVEAIPRTKSGKYRVLDQRLTVKYGDK